MDQKLKHNEWQVGVNIQSNDEGGGDLCPHAEDFTMRSEPDGRIIGAWRLPLAVQLRFENVVRVICVFCIQDKINELLIMVRAKNNEGAG
jgi:hypothetical protein